MLILVKLLLIIHLEKDLNHAPQNGQFGFQISLHPARCETSPQELRHESNARRDPALECRATSQSKATEPAQPIPQENAR